MNTARSMIAAIERAEVARQRLLATLAQYDPSLLSISPAPGSWSAAQVVLHLAIAEEGALAYLRKKLQYGGHQRVTLIGGLRLLALRLAFALPVRWRAPQIIADIPAVGWKDALARWDRIRHDWRSTLEQLPSELATHDLFKHPVAGKLTLLQGIRFMATHVQHHRKQILRTIRQVAQ